ncbi:type 2 lanthipeptide synthetase LanM family protein [Mucilaginibacter sp. AK015]|uniref:type 2 lanthipeptide synthetase LanM family protein n=1 Tax=Mucilaginibacter sp. AK015 TaxID=2723072 RepID=UPI0016136B0F|nr:type 2 lanthipeptide synthetase LanM family protein [Mucilaginibacter sp. AK015]MBB5395655.1 type 2 lantibiotic biosynthesis protein LanM [Mucilaginibacter sp. AK015]
MDPKAAVLSDGQTDIFDLSIRGQFLTERINQPGAYSPSIPADDMVEKRFTKWAQTAAQGKADLFLKRLSWDGLDEGSARRLLADGDFYPDSNTGNWTEILENCMKALMLFSPETIDPATRESLLTQVPFWELCYPFAQYARERLDVLIADDPQIFNNALITPDVLDQFQAALLNQLADDMGSCLYNEFKEYRPKAINQLNILLQEPVFTTEKDRHYQAFVTREKANGLSDFFTKYAALGRVVTCRIAGWLETTAEFLIRLQQDLQAIQIKFGPGFNKALKVEPGLSDYHNGGRTVIAVHFASGDKLVYKPKNGGVEAAYYSFLTWCNYNMQDNNCAFHVSAILDLDTHCWVQYIDFNSCTEPTQIARFYERSGMLLAAIYLLGGVDCHYENLIAMGEYPVLVDTETLLHPYVNKAVFGQHETKASNDMEELFWDSVLRTGMLPRWEFGKDPKMSVDVSGFGSEDQGQERIKRLEWLGINTDSMSRKYKEYERPQKQNMPLLNGQAVSFQPYTDNIIAGFERFYQFIYSLSPLEKKIVSDFFKNQKIRYVYRSTNIYTTILRNAMQPEALQTGIDFSIEVDVLAAAYISEKQLPISWPIFEEERTDLLNLDIPYFSCSTGSTALTLRSGTVIPNFFRSASFNDLVGRIACMSPAKLAQQVSIIRGAFHARFSQNYERLEALKERKPLSNDIPSKLNPDELLAEAVRIGNAIENTAIAAADSLNWIGLAHFPEADRYQLQPLDDSLYSGRCGIALFLATLYQVSGVEKYKTLALNSISALRANLQVADEAEREEVARLLKIGAASGIGSFIYALTRIADLLNESELLTDAYKASTFLTKKVISEDRHLDIISGSSGAILGLLALYKGTKNQDVLQRAIWCGQHLASQISAYDGHQAWLTFEDTPLCGFAHGAAGIAYALLRLYAVTDDTLFLETANKGIAFEDAMYSAAHKNWPDLRSFSFKEGTYGFTTTWCHGAPGIGLARLATLDINPSPVTQQHINAAIDCTLEFGTDHPDYLCCGNFGRMDFLLEASRKLNRPQLRDQAEVITARILKQAAEEGNYQLFCNTPSTAFKPGLFLGMAGIGYQLLRLYASNVPSVLLWES